MITSPASMHVCRAMKELLADMMPISQDRRTTLMKRSRATSITMPLLRAHRNQVSRTLLLGYKNQKNGNRSSSPQVCMTPTLPSPMDSRLVAEDPL
jgi:hypothetical protein